MEDGLLKRERGELKGEYGKSPDERTVEELLRWGVVNLDKPSGPTSHQIVSWVKGILDIKKAGHGGTLDPKVTGVLPIGLGRATKAIKVLLKGEKEYVGVMLLHRDVPEKRIRDIFDSFRGEIYQLPPVRAAVKRRLRTRRIYHSEIIEIRDRKVLFRVRCEAGTYIRTLCHDMGEALGVGAHMAQLRRTGTAAFCEENLVSLHHLKDSYVFWRERGEDAGLRNAILPFERLFDHMPRVVIKDTAASAVSHGAPLAVVGITRLSDGIGGGDQVVVLSARGEAIALGRAVMSTEEMLEKKKGLAVEMDRVLRDDIFPKLWRRGRKGD